MYPTLTFSYHYSIINICMNTIDLLKIMQDLFCTIFNRLQVFHMLSHEGTGGETLLVDGFNAANNVRIANPEAFDLLCNTPIEAEYIEPGIHFSTVDTVIKVHPVTKELFQIRWVVSNTSLKKQKKTSLLLF